MAQLSKSVLIPLERQPFDYTDLEFAVGRASVNKEAIRTGQSFFQAEDDAEIQSEVVEVILP